ncbi:MAG: DUF434 domain-containing protein [Thaumarchaeota archaeon]|jgi:hypothetical protein|nr:DUF434 domain-containing protein [Candidatus Geocrenenecus arthurdayi]MCL7390545.1 DUF434 domain-containing protein [Candidatus Geocrenenecus arthurdayi]MCL7396613.1 DUF434 domain-containing protein [Candidatus Geocrenenecus arthurdayi]MCL7403277.1 DUF434 domain-containing protein [Candidatus Geocrenenecus arthurdayi]
MYDRFEVLKEAAVDLRYLLDRGYRKESALRLIGDKYQLDKSERLVLYRSTYSKNEIQNVKEKMLESSMVAGKDLWIDGFNVLNTVEAALKGELLILCDDGIVRDFSQVYGRYRFSQLTLSSLQLIMGELKNLHPSCVRVFYDSQISKSGEIAKITREVISNLGLRGDAETTKTVDSILSKTDAVVCTSDSVILSACRYIFDLAGYIITSRINNAVILTL